MNKRPLFTLKEKIIGGILLGTASVLLALGLTDIAVNKEDSVVMKIAGPLINSLEQSLIK